MSLEPFYTIVRLEFYYTSITRNKMLYIEQWQKCGSRINCVERMNFIETLATIIWAMRGNVKQMETDLKAADI